MTEAISHSFSDQKTVDDNYIASASEALFELAEEPGPAVRLVFDSKFKPEFKESVVEPLFNLLCSLKLKISKIELLVAEQEEQYLAKIKRDPFWYDRKIAYVPIEGDFLLETKVGNSSICTGKAHITDHWNQHSVVGKGILLKIAGFPHEMPASTFNNSCYQDLFETYISTDSYSHYHLRIALEFLIERLPKECAEDVPGHVKKGLSKWRYLTSGSRGNIPLAATIVEETIESLNQPLDSVTFDNGASALQFFERSFQSVFSAYRSTFSSADLSAIEPLRTLYDRPIFIVAAPRSGSTMLFEALQQNQKLWTLGDESHQIFESISAYHPASRDFVSNALDAEDLEPESARALLGAFSRKLCNAQGRSWLDLDIGNQPSHIRFLEKTPKNALRIKFLKALFPDAKFIFLHRTCEANVGSIIDAWESGNFITYPNLPGREGRPWSLLLTPGWKNMNNSSLASTALQQWSVTNQFILDSLNDLSKEDWISVNYEALLEDKASQLERLCAFMDVPFGPRMKAVAMSQGNSKYTLSAPVKDKWRRHAEGIKEALELNTSVRAIIGRLEVL